MFTYRQKLSQKLTLSLFKNRNLNNMTPQPIQDDGTKNSEYGENYVVLEKPKGYSDFNESVEIKRVIENTASKSKSDSEDSADERPDSSSEGYLSGDGN